MTNDEAVATIERWVTNGKTVTVYPMGESVAVSVGPAESAPVSDFGGDGPTLLEAVEAAASAEAELAVVGA